MIEEMEEEERLSTLRQIRTKNVKKNIENSKKVKTDIADERYEIYKKIIGYINSWYDCKPDYSFDYHTCPGIKNLEMSFVEQRLKNREDIEKEINTINQLSINYFYLDGKTYKLLKALEKYLSNVLNYIFTKDIDNKNFLYYVVYGDLWKYLFKMSKSVNKFMRSKDVLEFSHSKSIKKKYIRKHYKQTNFYSLYGRALEIDKLENKLEECFQFKTIKECKASLKKASKLEREDLKAILSLYKRINRLRKKDKRNFSSKIYKLKKNCENCKNTQCAFSQINAVNEYKVSIDNEI